MKASEKAKLGADEMFAIAERAMMGYNNVLLLEAELDSANASLEVARSLLKETLRLYPNLSTSRQISKFLKGFNNGNK